jgi:SPOR domain
LACSGNDGSNPVREAMTAARPPAESEDAVVFQFPRAAAGAAHLRRLPALSDVAWHFDAARRGTASVVGFASDDDLVYTLSSARELVALDLTSGRARVITDSVRLGAIGPEGTIIVVREDSSVNRAQYRGLERWTTTFSAPPTAIWPAIRDRVIGIVPGDSGRTLELLADGQQPIRQSLPDGALAVTRWGDVVAVAADSGLVLLDPTEPDDTRFLSLNPAPVLVTFSESAHRVYCFDHQGTVTAFDRFTLAPVESLRLPGAPLDVRSDPEGDFLLVRPTEGDSLWVLDLVGWSVSGTIAGEWTDRLPLVASDGTILLERGGDLVAVAPTSRTVVARAPDAEDSRWLPIAWDPRRPALELVSQAPVDTSLIQPTQEFYVQISSTSNRDWAEDMAANLRRAGIDASVLEPEYFDTRYRVALGPYDSHEAADAIRRTLNMPSWIFTRDTTRSTP